MFSIAATTRTNQGAQSVSNINDIHIVVAEVVMWKKHNQLIWPPSAFSFKNMKSTSSWGCSALPVEQQRPTVASHCWQCNCLHWRWRFEGETLSYLSSSLLCSTSRPVQLHVWFPVNPLTGLSVQIPEDQQPLRHETTQQFHTNFINLGVAAMWLAETLLVLISNWRVCLLGTSCPHGPVGQTSLVKEQWRPLIRTLFPSLYGLSTCLRL